VYHLSSKKRNPQKFFNFTPDEIKEYLEKFRKCVLDGRYSISQNRNRQENIDFIEDYKIHTKKEQEILLGLQFDDFCYAVENDNVDFAHEVLYIFCKKHELDFWGMLEIVDIYIKVNMIETRSGDLFSFVVSFHKRNFEITYLFR
jgi:hypothetical protein